MGGFTFFFLVYWIASYIFVFVCIIQSCQNGKKTKHIITTYWDPGWLHAKKKKIYTITKRCLKITHNLVKLIHHLDIFNHQLINYTYCKISLQTRRTNNVALIFCFQRKKLRNIFWCIFNLPPKLHLQSLKSIEIYENLVCSLKKKKN